jgi:hypothetical protein
MDVTLPAAKRSRQSIAHLPSKSKSDDLKENVTDVVSSSQRSRNNGPQTEKKKTRGKSLGPGGLEALKEISGNASQVIVDVMVIGSQMTDMFVELNIHATIHTEAYDTFDTAKSYTQFRRVTKEKHRQRQITCEGCSRRSSD